jgi:hypothetical protein
MVGLVFVRLVLVRGVGVGFWTFVGATVELPDPNLPVSVGPGLERLVCGAVVMGSGQLGRCHRLDVIREVEA